MSDSKVGRPEFIKKSLGKLTPDEIRLREQLQIEQDRVNTEIGIGKIKSQAFWIFIKNSHNTGFLNEVFIEDNEVFTYEVGNLPQEVFDRITKK